MKCISIIASRRYFHSMGPMGGVGRWVVTNAYPSPLPGIVAVPDEEDNYWVYIGDKRIPVSQRWPCHIGYVQLMENGNLRIYEATIGKAPDGGPMIVPGRPEGDDGGRLILCDISRGIEGTVRLVTAGGAKLIASDEKHWELLVGSEQVALVELPSGGTLSALRESKRFIWFGAISVREALHYRNAGDKIEQLLNEGGEPHWPSGTE